MDELAIVNKLCDALEDDEWHYLQVPDDQGGYHEFTRIDTIDYLAALCPEMALPPSAMH